MNRETAVETVYRARKYNGVAELESRLESDTLGEDYNDQFANAVATLGRERVRQLLGLDGELWYTLWSAKTADVDEEASEIQERLHSLWLDGKIADYDVRSIPKRLSPNFARDDQIRMYREFHVCAARKSLTLDPFFRREDDTIVLPDLFLVIRSVSHRLYSLPTEDRDTSGLNLVFPCSDGRNHYTINDYLSAVESGEEWRCTDHVDSLTYRDHGAHGAIKARIAQHPAETIGSEWQLFDDERGTGNFGANETGRIDLVFSHRSDRRFLLVEVKPSREVVDSAFGQLGRYKYQFLKDDVDIQLTADDIDLAIAAPEFAPSHERFADEIGIRSFKIDM